MRCPREKVMTIARNFLRKAGYRYPTFTSVREQRSYGLFEPPKCIVECNVGPPLYEKKNDSDSC